MGRSSPRGSRAGGGRRRAAPAPPSSHPGTGSGPPRSLASAVAPRVWQSVGYRPLPEAGAARPLFEFAAASWPTSAPAFGWGALAPTEAGERLVGAVLAVRQGPAFMLYGPVVTAERDAVEIAAQLVAAALDHAAALGADTVFTRPQGLDRVWVRFGFIPVPESTLPEGLGGRAERGLYAWRGGSALWTLREAEQA